MHSTSHEALATTRLTPSAMAVGQAAGIAAALALTSGRNPAHIDVTELQRQLKEDGMVV